MENTQMTIEEARSYAATGFGAGRAWWRSTTGARYARLADLLVEEGLTPGRAAEILESAAEIAAAEYDR